MKKLIIILIVFLLAGCSSDSTISDDETVRDKYLTYYQSILDAESFLTKSDYFDIDLVLNAEEDGSYRYSVIIDNPKIAMYNMEIMAVVDDGSLSVNEEVVMPTLGILNDSYNMVPYQVSLANNYAEGLVLDGTVDTDKVSVLILVMWSNSDSSETTRNYFNLEASLEE